MPRVLPKNLNCTVSIDLIASRRRVADMAVEIAVPISYAIMSVALGSNKTKNPANAAMQSEITSTRIANFR